MRPNVRPGLIALLLALFTACFLLVAAPGAEAAIPTHHHRYQEWHHSRYHFRYHHRRHHFRRHHVKHHRRLQSLRRQEYNMALRKARWHYLRGEALAFRGDRQGAIQEWEQTLRWKPDSTFTLKALVKAFRHQTLVASNVARDPVQGWEQEQTDPSLAPPASGEAAGSENQSVAAKEGAQVEGSAPADSSPAASSNVDQNNAGDQNNNGIQDNSAAASSANEVSDSLSGPQGNGGYGATPQAGYAAPQAGYAAPAAGYNSPAPSYNGSGAGYGNTGYGSAGSGDGSQGVFQPNRVATPYEQSHRYQPDDLSNAIIQQGIQRQQQTEFGPTSG